jgi:hypothetical protein
LTLTTAGWPIGRVTLQKCKNAKIGGGGHNAVKAKTGTCQEIAILVD